MIVNVVQGRSLLGRFASLLMVAVAALTFAVAPVAAANGGVIAARVCTPGYTPCIVLKPSDVDCYGGSGNGPRYTKPGVVYTVKRGMDRYRLDSDGNGKGCERN